MRTRSALAFALLAACGSPSEEHHAPPTSAPPASEATTETPPETPPTGAPTHAPTPDVAYELHEWGVIDVSSGVTHVTAGPERRIRPAPSGVMRPRKPVIYVHLLDGATEGSFTVRVGMPGGTYAEHFPPGRVTDEGLLEWPSVVARATACRTSADPSAPTLAPGAEPALPTTMPSWCHPADGVCELAELPRYDAESAACVTVGTQQAGLLFYRGSRPDVPLPLTVARAPSGGITVHVNEALDGAPGEILRLTSNDGVVRVSRLGMPAPESTIPMPLPHDTLVRADAIAELVQSLRLLGMDEHEAHAFVEAWECELFGQDPAAPQTGEPLHPLGDALVYFLPPSMTSRISEVSGAPPPRAIRRAFLVRVDLSAIQ
jgi:hypothetical protein